MTKSYMKHKHGKKQRNFNFFLCAAEKESY